jgi:hypothetical protein
MLPKKERDAGPQDRLMDSTPGRVSGRISGPTRARADERPVAPGALPLDQISGGITAHFTADAAGYSIQRADALGFTPAGFSGYCLYPNSVFKSDLFISFSQPLKDIGLLYAPEEYATDSSCTMRRGGMPS